ncbi:hypothetical protein BRD00_05135 [Halobacteriales archaeon QS_8_69_26]|nr:MAG: hypothetical protein BRD00_05135 [Halobacteriales archaeon QS_8_69_26]
MNFATKLLAFGVWAIGVLGVALAVASPHLTGRQEATVIGGLVAVVGLPMFVMWVHWWVNASVFGSSGRRPGQV